LRQTVRAAEAFHARALAFAEEMTGIAKVVVPFPPDSNLVCLALNPWGNHCVVRMNAFMGLLQEELRCDPQHPLQFKEFLSSGTTLRPEAIGAGETVRLLAELGLDSASLAAGDSESDRLKLLRHTLMNPYLIDHENGISYIDLYFDYLARRVRALVDASV
jgi:hypothetical protein